MRRQFALPMIGASALLIGATTLAWAPEPRRWTPPAISTAGYEASPTFTPDGREMYYLSADAAFRSYRILQSKCVDGRWSEGVVPSFAAKAPAMDADPHVTADGRHLYFVSTRQDPAGEDFDIYVARRGSDGSWGVPSRLPPPVNSPASELLPRTDRSGALYFGSSRDGGSGKSDIYVARMSPDGAWGVRNLGPPVNTQADEYEAEVSQDGRTLILVADRGDRSHLYEFSRDRRGSWVEAGRIPARGDVFQVGPTLSPSGGSLLFAQAMRDRSGEIFLTIRRDAPTEYWPLPC